MMAKGVFITGTDTEVGKTIISVKLINELKAKGKTTIGFKPVASDATLVNGRLVNQDALELIAASSEEFGYEIHNPYVFEEAVSPNIAAAATEREPSLSIIEGNYRSLSKQCDIVVVEGAGGWRSPLSNSFSATDLVKLLKIPVILVVELKLGCINHALLSAEAMFRDGAEVLGWVANGPLNYLSREQEVLETLKQDMPINFISHIEKDGQDMENTYFDSIYEVFS